MNNEQQLTVAEWNVMECLWEEAPRTGRECVIYLEKSIGWSRSTTLTMLRRMSEKGLIECRMAEGMNVYVPLLDRQDAVLRETDSFLDRVYRGSVSMLMSAITKKQTLSKEEIDELYLILQQAEEANANE